jgi:hypothetical protein
VRHEFREKRIANTQHPNNNRSKRKSNRAAFAVRWLDKRRSNRVVLEFFVSFFFKKKRKINMNSLIRIKCIISPIAYASKEARKIKEKDSSIMGAFFDLLVYLLIYIFLFPRKLSINIYNTMLNDTELSYGEKNYLCYRLILCNIIFLKNISIDGPKTIIIPIILYSEVR